MPSCAGKMKKLMESAFLVETHTFNYRSYCSICDVNQGRSIRNAIISHSLVYVRITLDDNK